MPVHFPSAGGSSYVIHHVVGGLVQSHKLPRAVSSSMTFVKHLGVALTLTH